MCLVYPAPSNQRWGEGEGEGDREREREDTQVCTAPTQLTELTALPVLVNGWPAPFLEADDYSGLSHLPSPASPPLCCSHTCGSLDHGVGEGWHQLTTEAPPCAGQQKLLPQGLAWGILRGRKCPVVGVPKGLGLLSVPDEMLGPRQVPRMLRPRVMMIESQLLASRDCWRATW